VPSHMLSDYLDRPWSSMEREARARLVEDARKVLDADQFFQWKMDQDGSEAKPEAYHRMVWNESRRTPEDVDKTISRFRSTMDEKTIGRVMAMLTGDEVERQLAE
jgi:hypothetical protein